MSITTWTPAEPKIPQSLSRSARRGEDWPTHRAKARRRSKKATAS